MKPGLSLGLKEILVQQFRCGGNITLPKRKPHHQEFGHCQRKSLPPATTISNQKGYDSKPVLGWWYKLKLGLDLLRVLQFVANYWPA
jgi:hypothetical protein